MQNVRVAAELSSLSNRRGSSRGRGNNFGRGRGRGSGFGRQQSEDVFGPFLRRNFPNRRPSSTDQTQDV